MFKIYWIINITNSKTYVGFTNDLNVRLKQHKNKEVKSTKNFEFKKVYILENNIETIEDARKKEKYWKSAAGRKKLKIFFNMARSSIG